MICPTQIMLGSQKQKQTNKKIVVAPFRRSELVMAGQYLVVRGQALIEGVSY